MGRHVGARGRYVARFGSRHPHCWPHAVSADLRADAKAAQDRLGWASPTDHQEVTYATVDLARIVVTMAQRIQMLEDQVLALRRAS